MVSIPRDSVNSNSAYGNEGGDDETTVLQYSMRHAKEPVPLNGDHFPIATKRIQSTMAQVLEFLNPIPVSETGSSRCSLLKRHLASVSFDSSWSGLECIVEFNYSQPIYDLSYHSDGNPDVDTLGAEAKSWIGQAKDLCRQCRLTSLILRSKKKKLVIGRNPAYLQDQITIAFNRSRSIPVQNPVGVDVSLVTTQQNLCINPQPSNQPHTQSHSLIPPTSTTVFFQKPNDAFQHPNGTAIITALNLMITKLYTITSDLCSNNHKKELALLEMYCGCGAHTMAISKSNLFDVVVAVEIDPRLVDSCRNNCLLNGCAPSLPADREIRVDDTKHNVTPVHVFQGDAGQWSKRSLNRRRRIFNNQTPLTSSTSVPILQQQHNEQHYVRDYQVLLVDPPRSGLDSQVIQLALEGTFSHVLYVSCGRKALEKDLKKLHEQFEVVSCEMMDLFPRTDSVETLVHLRRKM